MDINEIENNLNNFPVDPDKAIMLTLNTVVKNQAMLHTLLELQINAISYSSGTQRPIVHKDVYDKVNAYVLEIQADISGHL